MLIQFSCANFRSIADMETLSLVAAPLASQDAIDRSPTFMAPDGTALLRSVALYGANAAGKSNLFKAMNAFRFVAVHSQSRLELDDGLPVIEPFLLSTETETAPSFFEAVFIHGERRFRYGLEATEQVIVSEWLFEQTSSRETRLFTRENQEIDVNRAAFKEGRRLENNTRPNASFLSLCASLQGAVASEVVQWLKHLNVISGLKDNGYRNYTVSRLMDGPDSDDILHLLSQLDVSLGQVDLEFPIGRLDLKSESLLSKVAGVTNEEIDEVTIGDKLKLVINTPLPKRNASGHIVGEAKLKLVEHASEGTQKLFAFAGPLVDTLKYGKVLFVDELDARLHPIVSAALIKLFNSRETNPKNAQLIFATHDVNLLSPQFFRRDQIWFAEKNEHNATHLYSLAQFRLDNGELARKNGSFESDYIHGKFGAIPFLGDLNPIFANPPAEVLNGKGQ